MGVKKFYILKDNTKKKRLGDKIKVSKFYWRFRHLLNRSIWQKYYDDSFTERRNFYSDFVSRHNCKSVYEFGCGGAPNLKNISSNFGDSVYIYGYDISRAAIDFSRARFDPKYSFFTTLNTKRQLELALHQWHISKFDLAIYDRVLCYLTLDEINHHFENFSEYFNYIIIDDFHSDELAENNGKFCTQNFVSILKRFDFVLLHYDSSQHLVSDDMFFARNAKRLAFARRQRQTL